MQLKSLCWVGLGVIWLWLGCARSADDAYNRAETAFARGAYQQALDECLRLQEKYPTYTKAYLLAARIHESRDDPAGAVLACRRGLENGADSVALELVLGRIYRQAGELERAYDYYRRILRQAPDNTAALKAAAEILKSQGFFKRAENLYRRLLKGTREALGVHLALAEVLLAQGKDSAAVAELKQLLEENPLAGRAYSLLAVAGARSGMPTDSVRAYHQRALQLAPTDSTVEKNYLRFLAQAGPVTTYLQQLQHYTARFPQDPWGHRRLGALYKQLGASSPTWLEAALKEYRRLVELDPQDAAAQAGMAEIYLQQGKKSLARLRARLAFEISPSPLYQALLDSVKRYAP